MKPTDINLGNSPILASLVLVRDDRWSRSGLVGLHRRRALPPEPLRTLGGRSSYELGQRLGR